MSNNNYNNDRRRNQGNNNRFGNNNNNNRGRNDNYREQRDYDDNDRYPQDQRYNNNNQRNQGNRSGGNNRNNNNNNNRNSNPRQRNPPPPAVNQGPPPPAQKSGPSLQPKHVSSTNTAEKNDPMILNGVLIEGLLGYTEVHQDRKYAVDMTGFNQLLRTSYEVQTEESDRALKKYVPFSVWAYYHTTLMWKAFYRALGVRSDLSSVNHSLEALVPDDLPCATDIANYIEGLGHVIDESGRHVYLDIIRRFSAHATTGAQGGFGRIDAQTHVAYETMIAPIITLLKIRADVAFTDGEIENANWDLPRDLRPTAQAWTLPNENLLGWRRAERLTDNQREIIRSAGVNDDTFSVANVGFLPINQQLIQAVASYMLGGKNPNHKVLTYSSTGSVAVIPFAVRVRNDTDDNGRTIASKQFIGKSSSQFTSHIASGAAVFRYRFNRILPPASGDAHGIDYICYNRTGDYPGEWIANANMAFEHGIASTLWNSTQFNIPEMNGYSVQVDYSRSARKKTTRE